MYVCMYVCMSRILYGVLEVLADNQSPFFESFSSLESTQPYLAAGGTPRVVGAQAFHWLSVSPYILNL